MKCSCGEIKDMDDTDIYCLRGDMAHYTTGPCCYVLPAAPLEKPTTGIKHDQNKPDMSLLSTIALLKVAEVMTFGKRKYSAHNWRGGFVWSRPLAAALRHIFAFLGGEDNDPETGLSHLAHAICCLIFVLEFTVTRPDLDDRYKPETKCE